ncbi:MAG TPA: serine/threonine-protein kinase [Ramlibacter sp.]|nr:serine/threonine-protein kinase [Ramlibacter sp.]
MLPSFHFLAAATGQPVGWRSRAIPSVVAQRPVLAMLQPSIDGYRIDRIIGAGRAATVYLADDLRRGGNVALKFLKGSCGESEAISQGFATECAVLSAIRHAHVVRAIEHRTGSAPCYLAMEYLGGGSLRGRIRRGVGPEEAFTLLRQAADGLARVHRLAVVHRDLKPENFLMRWPGEMALIDFGVAASRGDSAARVAPGRLVGTAAYTAPEQAQGESPDTAADVYSLGIVFYEMLRGRRPFAGTTVLEALSQHLVAPVPRLPGTLAPYQGLIDRMLEKRPQRRLPDADAVLQEIERMAAAGIASTTS